MHFCFPSGAWKYPSRTVLHSGSSRAGKLIHRAVPVAISCLFEAQPLVVHLNIHRYGFQR